MLALSIVHLYLTESEISPLHREFVEGGDSDEPVCSSVSCGLVDYRETFQCAPNRISVERILHAYASQGQILALTQPPNVSAPVSESQGMPPVLETKPDTET